MLISAEREPIYNSICRFLFMEITYGRFSVFLYFISSGDKNNDIIERIKQIHGFYFCFSEVELVDPEYDRLRWRKNNKFPSNWSKSRKTKDV